MEVVMEHINLDDYLEASYFDFRKSIWLLESSEFDNKKEGFKKMKA